MISVQRQADSALTPRPNSASRWLVAYGVVAPSVLVALNGLLGSVRAEHSATTPTFIYVHERVAETPPASYTPFPFGPNLEGSDAFPSPQPAGEWKPNGNSAATSGIDESLSPRDEPNFQSRNSLGVGDRDFYQLSTPSGFAGGPLEPSGRPDNGPGDGPGGPGGGFGGPDDEPGYGLSWYPSASVVGQGTELGMMRNRVGLDVPVWFKDADAVMLSFGVDHMHFSGEAILPDTHRPFPKDLWNITFGLKHMHQFENDWSSMLMFDVGSASDEPFKSARDVSYTIGGFPMIPARNTPDMWMLGAIYSPFGSPSMPFPIPLLSYKWNPSECFNMSIGLPLDITWKPTDKFTIKLDYIPLLNINAIGTYQFTEGWSAYGGYQYVNGQYVLSDRVNRDDNFVLLEQQLVVGVRKTLGEHFVVDLATGYAFDRQFGVGEGMNQTNLRDKVELEAGAFLAARLNWNF